MNLLDRLQLPEGEFTVKVEKIGTDTCGCCDLYLIHTNKGVYTFGGNGCRLKPVGGTHA